MAPLVFNVKTQMPPTNDRATKVSRASDLQKFILYSNEYWDGIKAGSSKRANAANLAAMKMAKKHRMDGDLVAFLEPLLTHESAVLRLSSAAELIRSEASELAIGTLFDLLTDPTLIASSAAAVLRVHGISRTPHES